MVIDVVIDTVLFYTDAPDLVLSRDEFGATYLCQLVRLDETGHEFLTIPISDERLAMLRDGSVDLRTVLLEPERRGYFVGHLPPGERRSIRLEAREIVPDEWFPDPGFLLNSVNESIPNEDVVKDALRKNAAVVVCRMNPPEARGSVPRVDAERLAQYIIAFQSLVRESAKHALKLLPKASKENAVSPFALHVFGFSRGSFNIHFESADHADLYGTSVVGAAMAEVDELMRLANEPPDTIAQRLEAHKGPVLAAYQNLLRHVEKQDAPLSYRWAEPALAVSKGERITPDAAKAIVALLDEKKALTREPFAFVGRFTTVNTEHKPLSWTARDHELKKRNGFLHEQAQEILNGVTIKALEYAFEGEERLVSTPSAIPAKKLYLRSVTPTGA